MVYLKHNNTGTFWCCHKSAKKSAIISFGKCGFPGRAIKKTDFKNGAEVAAFIRNQRELKMRIGYIRARDPTPPKKMNQRRAKRKSASQKTNQTKKRKNATKTQTKKEFILKKDVANPKISDGEMEVDSGLSRINPALVSEVCVHDVLHAELALVDPTNKSDNFHIIQVLIKQEKGKNRQKTAAKKSPKESFFVFSRFGRTGTQGTAQLEKMDNEKAAKTRFCEIFKVRTGVEWESGVRGAEPQHGKFEFLNMSERPAKSAKWFYYLTNDPFGKADGWYKYDDENSREVEELFSKFVASNRSKRLSTRLVHSETSGYTYAIDLDGLAQTNTTTQKKRPIKRIIDGDEQPSS